MYALRDARYYFIAMSEAFYQGMTKSPVGTERSYYNTEFSIYTSLLFENYGHRHIGNYEAI